MKIKLDENVPARLGQDLRDLGHEVDTVQEEGLTGEADPQVWRAAQEESRFLITQDLDFSDMRQFAPGSHHGLLLVRLRDPGRDALATMIREVFSSQNVADWAGCFVVVTERKIRVLRPVG